MSNCEKLARWPCVTTDKSLTKEMNFSSPFGGLIYLESPGSGSLAITLSNVVQAPFLDLSQPETIRDWAKRRQAPGLWVISF